MRISYRQGLISAQANYIQIGQTNTNFVDLVVNPTPIIASIASGDVNYLIGEYRSITNAWGPFSGAITQYLYWEINQATGIVSRGFTHLAPVTSASAPSQVLNQMWFDLNEHKMKVWNGTRWVHTLRVLAGKLHNGANVEFEAFSSQVGLDIAVDAGFIMTDGLGGVFKTTNGDFLTSNTEISAPDTGSLVKIDGSQITIIANENIPRFSLVYLQNGRAALASSDNQYAETRAPIGVVTTDAYQNSPVNLIGSGKLIVNEQWQWTASNFGKPVYCGQNGEITVTKPNALKVVEVGHIINANSVLLNICWSTEATPPSNGLSGINAISPILGSGSALFPTISIQPASATQSGSMAPAQFQEIAYAIATLPNKADLNHLHTVNDVTGLQSALNLKSDISHLHVVNDVTGLQSALNLKSDIGHTHTIADTTGLQTNLDNIEIALTSKVDKLTATESSQYNILILDTSGGLLDSGYEISDLALASHQHAINDVTNLSDTLNAKANLSHAHTIADVNNLQNVLDDKANVLHVHQINQVLNLPETLDLKANIGHTHAIADTLGLQTALDLKANISHVHIISDVTDLQNQLDGRSLIGHSHNIANINGLQLVLDSKANISHGHIINDITGLVDALDAKANVIHTHLAADITDLQPLLDLKSDVGHHHAVTDVDGLQSLLDLKADVVHQHVINDTIGLQTALNSKAPLSHTHYIIDVVDLQPALDLKSNVGHVHDISELLHVDVLTVAPGIGQVLGFDGTNWVPMNGGGVNYLSQLLDVSLVTNEGGIPLGDTLIWTAGDGPGYWRNGKYDIANLANVDLTSTTPIAGDALIFDGINWVPGSSAAGGAAISNLLDVEYTAPSTGDILVYDGLVGKWIVGSQLAGMYGGLDINLNLVQLKDVTLSNTLSDKLVLGYDIYTQKWVDMPIIGNIITSIEQTFQDVYVPSKNVGDVLTWNGTYWTASPSTAGTTFRHLTDVNLTPVVAYGEQLHYNNTSNKWENFMPDVHPKLRNIAPSASTDPGEYGEVAFYGDDFFFHNGNEWRKITGSVF